MNWNWCAWRAALPRWRSRLFAGRGVSAAGWIALLSTYARACGAGLASGHL